MNHPETTIDFLLGVARDAIRQRAAQDSHAPDAYDAEGDPEGFVTSLLNALHHWCNHHNLDWELELARADDLFQQDLDEAGGETIGDRCPTISELVCPACGHAGRFFVQATENLLIDADGTQLEGDEGAGWSRSSPCACPACSHAGYLFQFLGPFRKE